MKHITIAAIIALLATLPLSAGDWGKEVVSKNPIEECHDIGGQISGGYMTDYFFHGLRQEGDSVWTDVNYTFSGLSVPVTIGVWYLNALSSLPDDELDVYIEIDLGEYLGFDITAGYTHYFFPESPGTFEYGEAKLVARRSLRIVDLRLATNYAFEGSLRGGWYHEAGLEKTFELTDSIDLVISGGVAFFDGNFAEETGFSHYFATLSLPIYLNCRSVLTPYVGFVGAPEGSIAAENQSDNLHGGVSIAVSF